MGFEGESFDHFEEGWNEPHRPDIEEVFKRFEDGTLSEVAEPGVGGSSQDVIFMAAPKPDTDDTLALSVDGSPVYDASYRFSPDFTGWAVGDIVRVHPASAHVLEMGRVSLRADTANWRNTVEYYQLGEQDQQTLARYGMARMDLEVKIVSTDSGESIVPIYEVAIETLHSVEPTWDGVAKLEKGKPVLIEAVADTHEPGSYQQDGSLVLLIDEIEPTSVVLKRGGVYLDQGVLDVIYPPTPLPGDTIQVRPIVDQEAGDLTIEAAYGAHLGYLVSASPERQEAYNAAREDIARQLADMHELDGADFRAAYGALMRDYRPHTPQNFRDTTLLLSFAERTALAYMRAEKFPPGPAGVPNPEDLISEYAIFDRIVETGAAYAADTVRMSRQEYYDFCMQFANGERLADQVSERENSQVYPFADLEGKFPHTEVLEIVKKVMDTWLPGAMHKTTPNPYDPEDTFDPAKHIEPHVDNILYWASSTLSYLHARDSTCRAYGNDIHEQLSTVCNGLLASYRRD